MSTQIEHKLQVAWKRERSFSHLRGLGWMVPWLVGIFLVDLLLDWSFELPGAVRIGLLAVNVAIVGWLLYRHWLQYLHRYDAQRVSLQVERLHPGLNSMIVSYVQLNEKARPHGSPWMIEAMRRQATAVAAPLDFSGIVDFTKLRTLLAIAGVVVALFLGSCVFLGAFYLALIGRMLMPFSDLEYPTQTTVVANGPIAVKQGDKIELEAAAAGVKPFEGAVYLKIGEAPWESFTVARVGEGDFPYSLPKATQSIKYYYRIGDGRSAPREVKVVPPPRIMSAVVELKFPTYTGLDPKRPKLTEMSPIPEGTAAAWKIKLDQPIAGGKIVFGDDRRLVLPVEPDSEDPRLVRVNVADVDAIIPPVADRVIATAIPYHFEWTDKEHGFKFVDPTQYSLEVIPDKPPVITVYKPAPRGENDKVLATKYLTQEFQYAVADDYGPGKARISYRVNGGPERFVSLGDIPKLDAGQVIETKWRIGEWYKNLKEGDVVTFAVEATDNRNTKAGPNVGRSSLFQVNIVDAKEYQTYIDQQVALGRNRTTDTAREMLNSSKNLKTLTPEKTP